MARIVFRGLYAAFPMVGLTVGDLAYATDYLQLYSWDGAAWVVYSDYPDYQGEKVGIFPEAEWATREGFGVDIRQYTLNVAPNALIFAQHIVAGGRVLYITQFGFSSAANLVADADNNQICRGDIINFVTGVWYWLQGGNGGGRAVFSKSLVFLAGTTVHFRCANRANHNCDLGVYAGGYEI